LEVLLLNVLYEGLCQQEESYIVTSLIPVTQKLLQIKNKHYKPEFSE